MPRSVTRPKPRLLKVALEARLKPLLRRFPLLHPVASAIQGFPDWTTSHSHVRLIDKKAHCSLVLTNHEVRYIQDSGRAEIEETKGSQLSKKLLLDLEGRTLQRMGYRRWYLLELQMSFREAVDLFQSRYYAPPDPISGIGHQLDDVLYRVDSTDPDGWRWHVTFAPVPRTQAFELLAYDFNDHWDEGSTAAREMSQQLPEVGLFQDLDCYRQDTDISTDLWEDFVARSREKMHTVSTALFDSYFGRQPNGGL